MASETESGPAWMAEPESHDYLAADHFLRLMLHKDHVAVALKRLHKKHKKSRSFAAKDILRAAGLPGLPGNSEGVAAKLGEIKEGKSLAPVMLVRPDWGSLIIADGYHRVSASHIIGESTPVACVLVSVP